MIAWHMVAVGGTGHLMCDAGATSLAPALRLLTGLVLLDVSGECQRARALRCTVLVTPATSQCCVCVCLADLAVCVHILYGKLTASAQWA